MYNEPLIADRRKQNPTRDGLERTGLYHSIRLPDGRVLPGAMGIDFLEARLASFQLPADLRGKTVLDIGPWDGYFTFEMERRGAEVTAIDYVDLDTFRELSSLLKSKARYLRMDLYELDPKQLGVFDIVLCLGVLYHCKHPLLALEKICAVTGDLCVIDSYVVDAEAWRQGLRPPLRYLEFYETDELGGQLDNWCGPTVGAVEALVRAAGFAQAEVLEVGDSTARVAAWRKWQNLPADSGKPVTIAGLNCHAHRGRSFQSQKEEYLALWCAWKQPAPPPLEGVFPEVDGYGVAPLAYSLRDESLLVSVRVPPGLDAGEHSVRLKIGDSAWSAPALFYLDLPPLTSELRLTHVQDGIDWAIDQVDWRHGGWMTLWVEGLSPEADAGNTIVHIAGVPHLPEAVHTQTGQVNLRVRPVIKPGLTSVNVVHRGVASGPRTFLVRGERPRIMGVNVER